MTNASTTRRHNVWRPVTKRDTPSLILLRHRAIADETGVRAYAKKLKIKSGTMSRYLEGDYMPKANKILRALGLPTTRLVRANPPQKWRDMSLAELRRAIENRREYKPNG